MMCYPEICKMLEKNLSSFVHFESLVRSSHMRRGTRVNFMSRSYDTIHARVFSRHSINIWNVFCILTFCWFQSADRQRTALVSFGLGYVSNRLKTFETWRVSVLPEEIRHGAILFSLMCFPTFPFQQTSTHDRLDISELNTFTTYFLQY